MWHLSLEERLGYCGGYLRADAYFTENGYTFTSAILHNVMKKFILSRSFSTIR